MMQMTVTTPWFMWVQSTTPASKVQHQHLKYHPIDAAATGGMPNDGLGICWTEWCNFW